MCHTGFGSDDIQSKGSHRPRCVRLWGSTGPPPFTGTTNQTLSVTLPQPPSLNSSCTPGNIPPGLRVLCKTHSFIVQKMPIIHGAKRFGGRMQSGFPFWTPCLSAAPHFPGSCLGPRSDWAAPRAAPLRVCVQTVCRLRGDPQDFSVVVSGSGSCQHS